MSMQITNSQYTQKQLHKLKYRTKWTHTITYELHQLHTSNTQLKLHLKLIRRFSVSKLTQQLHQWHFIVHCSIQLYSCQSVQ